MLICPKCHSHMEEGFMIDQWDRFYRNASSWVEGTPETSYMNGVRLRGKRMIEAKTFRCVACGYLESYARP
jgi:hypothetical protein